MEAARVWEELADAHATAGDERALGEVARRLAGVYDLLGLPEQTRAARQRAATAFAAAGCALDAAAEQVAIAERLELAGSGGAALALIAEAGNVIERAGSVELRVRALALEGELRAKQGEREAGVACARNALALALEHDASAAAAEAYYRLGAALENASDHAGAVDAYTTAHGLCSREGIDELAEVCIACMLPALFLTGQWARSVQACREVLRRPASPPVARTKASLHLGLVRILRGEPAARRLLEESLAFGRRHELFPIEVFSGWGISRALVLQGEHEAAAAQCRELLERSAAREERHYCVPALRFAATVFARGRDAERLGECSRLLSAIAAAMQHGEPLAALGHALGELALLHGDAPAAAEHLTRAVELMTAAGIPCERAETQVRAGVALAAAGRRSEAVAELTSAYRTARRLAARPLALEAARELSALEEPVERHLGRWAAAELESGGGALAAAAPGAPARSRRADEPGHRERALPQQAHRRHAHAQPAREARLPLAYRGRREGPNARTHSLSGRNTAAGTSQYGLPTVARAITARHSRGLVSERKGETMRAISQSEAAVEIEGGGVELRVEEIGGGMSTAFVRLPAGTDLRPALQGLDDGLCRCPHWGYLLKGRLKMHTPNGGQVYEQGQAFYWAPGHAPEALADCEYVDFSPTEEFRRVIEHIKAQG